MDKNEIYEGFKLLETQSLKDINSEAMLFEHIKTGARLFYLKNDDNNKVFSISFRTPPQNSTGVPHIIEHSVLCGSRKFPVKEPFVELIKGSLNTFLNAMTFSDKTMYPVASKNDKDFMNLMDVYLDAVFYPNIYKYREIFMQEGWHYELENKDDDLKYNGVVYNEMKGAFSSPESVLMRKIQNSLFPDTTYGVESGGDPDDIPTLTYEDFIEFHKKYYHPSNSYIYLYGKMDIGEKLKFINDNYLNNFEKQEIDSHIDIQEPFENPIEEIHEYPISSNEKEEDKTFLSLNFAVGRSTNPEEYLAMDILENILLESESSPLKKALISANLGKDVYGFYDKSILQPVFSIIVKNSNLSEKDKFKKVVYETLTDLVKNGIDKKLIEASINRKEFDLREANYQSLPKGLVYGISCMDSWLYDKSPLTHLNFSKTLDKIKTALSTDYFERLIDKFLLNNNHCSLLVVRPAKGLVEQKEKELTKSLKEFKDSLSSEQINKIIEDTKKLRERQTTPDSKEDLEKIPLLSLSDIKKEADVLPLVEKQELNTKVLHHPIFTSGIGYLNLYFDMSALPEELVPYASLLSKLLGKISTKNYNYEDLSNEIDINTGGITFNISVYGKFDDDKVIYPKFIVKSKVLVEKMPKLAEILAEIISNTRFDEKDKIKELIQKTKSRLEMIAYDAGHMVAVQRAASYFSPSSKYNELISGIDFYKFVSNIDKNFEAEWKRLSNALTKVSEVLFNKSNVLVSFTGSEEDYIKFRDVFNVIYNRLGDNRYKPEKFKAEYKNYNEGFMTPGKVQFVAKGYNYRRLGYTYTGALKVFKTIANFDYLWNNIRVQGGAYGCMSYFNQNGNLLFVSYRDPNLKNTLDVYDNIDSYIENFEADEREMTKYIIGTISEIDTTMTPSLMGEISDINYIRKLTQEDIQKERDQILSTSLEDIKSLKNLFHECLSKNYICVLGNENNIKQNKNLFNNIVNLFE